MGISPTLVTLKKYVDEVVFVCYNGSAGKKGQLGMVWNYSGKIYFGQCRAIVEEGMNNNVNNNKNNNVINVIK